jgi:hypothetical protein
MTFAVSKPQASPAVDLSMLLSDAMSSSFSLLRFPAENRYPRHLFRERVDVDDPPAVALRNMTQDAACARAVRVHVEERLAGTDELDSDILQERRFSDTRNPVHEGVVEAVDHEIVFDGKRVSVCSDGYVHGSGVPAAIDGRITSRDGGTRDG